MHVIACMYVICDLNALGMNVRYVNYEGSGILHVTHRNLVACMYHELK